MGNATSEGLGSEASHDERDIRYGGQYSDNRPIDIELAEEAKESEVPRPPASYNINNILTTGQMGPGASIPIYRWRQMRHGHFFFWGGGLGVGIN